MRRSSIFSFETLRPGGLRPVAAALALLVLVAFELGFARRPSAWTLVPNSPTGLVGVQDEIVRNSPVPRVVVVGNSRMIDAILPRELDRALGMPAGSTVNLSVQAGRPFDFLSVYRRHREELGRAELLIVGLEDNMFGEQMDSAEQRFRFLADRRERWRYQGSQRLSFVAGGYLRSLDAGGAALSMARAALRGKPDVVLREDLRIAWRQLPELGPAELPLAEIDRLVARNYSRYAFTLSQAGYLDELLEMCAADGIAVLPVRPPVRDIFLERARVLEPDRLARTQAGYSGLKGALLFGSASELAMRPEHFVDYGHLTLAGGIRFTAIVAKHVRGEFSDRFPGARPTEGG